MKLTNETKQRVYYNISGGGSADCGTIERENSTDVPGYQNTENVVVDFSGVEPGGHSYFELVIEQTYSGREVLMVVVGG